MSFQQITIEGNVGQDPEVAKLPSGDEVVNFSLAVTEKWKSNGESMEHTEWFRCVCFFAGLVDVVDKYVRKGDKLMVLGKLRTRKYRDQAGNDRQSTDVIVSTVNLIMPPPSSGGGDRGGGRDDRGGGRDDRGGGRDDRGGRGDTRGRDDRGGGRGDDRRGDDRRDDRRGDDRRGDDRRGDDRRGDTRGAERGRDDRGASRDDRGAPPAREPARAGAAAAPAWDAPLIDDEIPF